MHRSNRGVPITFALLLASCSSPGIANRARHADSMRDAGSVHLSVLAVAPWSHYVDALQPQFELDADRALAQVVRSTQSSAESSTQGSSVGVAATETGRTNDLPSPSSTSVRSDIISLGTANERSDAMLEYWNATSLFQEVQLLNRAIHDAPIPTGYRGYLVRLQLSLVPRRRHQPYDAYTTIAFFAPDAAESAPLAPPPAVDLRATEPASKTATGPSVLPLLVTDNLEAASKLRSDQSLDRFALSLLALPGNFASQLDVELFQQALSAQIRGRDLNSLLSVARISENALRVRIGAVQESTAGHAMVPRNHFITLLVLVPHDAPGSIEVVARTSFVDTETGAELEAASAEVIDALFAEVEARHEGVDRAFLEEVLALAQRNEQTGYRALMSKRFGDSVLATSLPHALWIDVVSLLIGATSSAVSFELPGHGRWEILPATFFDQTPLALDDGAAHTSVTIHGARFQEGVELAAALTLELDGKSLSLPADEIQVVPSNGVVKLSFPSLAAAGLADAARKNALGLRLSWAGETAEFSALYLPREKR